jgi:hypothetical protein
MEDKMETCEICGYDIIDNETGSTICAPCRKIISKYNDLTKAKVKDALRARFDKENSNENERHFKCVYTNISSTFNTTKEGGLDPLKDALVLTIDHENPKDKKNSDLVVSLNLINQMKSNLTSDKFKELVILLGKKFAGNVKEEDFEKQFKQLVGTLR